MEGKITGKLVIKDVFGKKANINITFSEKALEDVSKIIEGIEKIV